MSYEKIIYHKGINKTQNRVKVQMGFLKEVCGLELD